MAIAEMSRIRLYGLETERTGILSELMRFGAVQIEDAFEDPQVNRLEVDTADGAGQHAATMSLARPETLRDVVRLDGLVADTGAALELLRIHAPQKKPLFSIRRGVDRTQMRDVLARREEAFADAAAIRKLDGVLSERKGEETRLHGRLDFLAPWAGVGIDLSSDGTRATRMQAGTLPAAVDTAALVARLAEEAPAAVLRVFGSGREIQTAVAVWHADAETDALNVLKEAGWSRVSFRDYPGDPDAQMQTMRDRLAAIEKEKSELSAAIADMAPAREGLEALYDTLLMEREQLKATGSLAASGKVFLLTGWVPSDACGRLQSILDRRFTSHLHHEPPADDADMPVLVRNNKFTEAFQMVMNMYGTPSPKEIDPNFITLPFFILFFGMIMADAGYGLILTGASLFLMWRYKMEDTVRKFVKLVLFSGLATIGWGIVFGSFFGIGSLSKYALWFSPTGEGGTETLMIACLALGIFHLYVGMGMKAANLFRRRQYLDALCDVGFPYVMFTGFAMFVLPYVPGLDKDMAAAVSAAGLYVLGIGVVLVILTAGRKSSSLVGKLFGGLPRLYDIIGFLGDVLSYMRLLALCMAGGILSGLVNNMASDLGGLVAKIIGGTILLLFGHGINFAMGILGAFVHSCRLQYLEFFSKFLEGGGKPFRPFGPRTQYIVMKQED